MKLLKHGAKLLIIQIKFSAYNFSEFFTYKLKIIIMKTKKFLKFAMYTILFGWFPFMFLAAFGHVSSNADTKMLIVMIGFIICCVGGFSFLAYFRQYEKSFQSVDELEKERENYIAARMKYERALIKLGTKFLNDEKPIEKTE
jgi:hypothetical protein